MRTSIINIGVSCNFKDSWFWETIVFCSNIDLIWRLVVSCIMCCIFFNKQRNYLAWRTRTLCTPEGPHHPAHHKHWERLTHCTLVAKPAKFEHCYLIGCSPMSPLDWPLTCRWPEVNSGSSEFRCAPKRWRDVPADDRSLLTYLSKLRQQSGN